MNIDELWWTYCKEKKMPAQQMIGREWSFTFDRDVQPYDAGGCVDKRWVATDPNGHEHRWDKGYPTLELVVDESHECDGTEGFYSHDWHTVIDRSHYECRECRETVTPRLLPPGSVEWYEAGPPTAILEGYVDGRSWLRVLLTEPEAMELLNAEAKDATALRLLVDAPTDRIIERRWEG